MWISGAGARVRLEGCIISRSGDDNVHISEDAHVHVSACKIHDAFGSGLCVSDDGKVWLECNEIWGNKEGMMGIQSSSATPSATTREGPGKRATAAPACTSQRALPAAAR